MGGILAIALSALIPSAVRGIVLNDIGPDIGGASLGRILRHLGKDNPQSDWETATAALQNATGPLVPNRRRMASRDRRYTFREEEDGILHIDWDPLIVGPMRSTPTAPELWTLFRAIRAKPALAFRGENSDILSRRRCQK